MSDKSWVPYNGKSTMAARVIEALVVAAVVAGLTLWGNSKIYEAKFDNLCAH